MMRLSHATDARPTLPENPSLPPPSIPVLFTLSFNPSTFLRALFHLCSSQLCSSCSFFCPDFSRSAGPTFPPPSFLSFHRPRTSNAFKQSLYLRFDTPGDTAARNNERKTFPRAAATCRRIFVRSAPRHVAPVASFDLSFPRSCSLDVRDRLLANRRPCESKGAPRRLGDILLGSHGASIRSEFRRECLWNPYSSVSERCSATSPLVLGNRSNRSYLGR